MSDTRTNLPPVSYVLDQTHSAAQVLSPLFVLGCWAAPSIGLVALVPYLPFVIMAAGAAHAFHGFFQARNKQSGDWLSRSAAPHSSMISRRQGAQATAVRYSMEHSAPYDNYSRDEENWASRGGGAGSEEVRDWALEEGIDYGGLGTTTGRHGQSGMSGSSNRPKQYMRGATAGSSDRGYEDFEIEREGWLAVHPEVARFNKGIATTEMLTGAGLAGFGYYSYTQLSALGAYTGAAGSAAVFTSSVTSLCWAFMAQAWAQVIMDLIILDKVRRKTGDSKETEYMKRRIYKQSAKAIVWTVVALSVASKVAAVIAAVTAGVTAAVATAPLTSLLIIGMTCLTGLHTLHGLSYCKSNFFSKPADDHYYSLDDEPAQEQDRSCWDKIAEEESRRTCNTFLAP